MGRCQNRAVIPITLIMLVSSLIMVQGGVDYIGFMSYSEYPEPEEYAIVLTEEMSSYEINTTRPGYKIVIKDLLTNNTPISLTAISEETTLLHLTNITRIVGDSVAVLTYSSDIYLRFVRQDTDAEVTFVVENWYMIYIAYDILAMPPFYLFGAALFVICGFLMFNIEQECREFGGQSRWRRREGPVAIVILVLISALLALPLIYGYAHNSFVYRHLSDSETYEYSYILNEESPEIVLDFLDYLPENYYSAKIRVENLLTEEPIRIRTWDNSQFLAYLTSVHSFNDSRIEISIDDETFHNIDFRRIENNTMLMFNITVEWVYVGRISDPTIPTLLAVCAIVPASIALFQARVVSQILNRLVHQEYSTPIRN